MIDLSPKQESAISVKIQNRLKRALINEGLVTKEKLRLAEITAQRENETLRNMLIKLGFVTEEQLVRCIGDIMHVPYVNMRNYTIDRAVFDRLPYKIARRYKIIPLFMIEGVLTIAMSEPMDLFTVDNISKVAQCKVEVVIASKESIDRYYEEDNPIGWQERDAEMDFFLEMHGEDAQGYRFTDKSFCKDVSEGKLKFVTGQPDKYFQNQMLEISIHLPGPRDVKACMKGKGQAVCIERPGDLVVDAKNRKANITIRLCSSLRFERLAH